MYICVENFRYKGRNLASMHLDVNLFGNKNVQFENNLYSQACCEAFELILIVLSKTVTSRAEHLLNS